MNQAASLRSYKRQAISPQSRVAADQRAGRRNREVLVVEDDAEIRDAIVGVLEAEGYRVSGCEHGAAALARLRGGARPDAIVLDLMMPVMDGWSFRVEQKRDPSLAGIPVVALTADGSAKAEAIDADAYLKKPVGYDTLVATVDNVMLRIEARELRLRLDEAARLASLATLAGGMAHEINNPLAYTLISVEQALRKLRVLAGEEGEQSQLLPLVEALECALDGGTRVKRLVADLVTFSCGNVDARALVDVRSVVEAAIQRTSHEIMPRARLVREFFPVPPVAANDVRVGQVFQSLLMNAARAIPEGDPERQEIRVSTRTDDAGRVLVEIADTGCGIAAIDLPRIFDPFFTSRAVGEGMGLGLSTAYGTIRAIGGEIQVTSEPNRGSVFTVVLPAAPGTRTSTPASGVHRNAVDDRPRVLIVDDDAAVASAFSRALEGECNVEVARDANDAIDHIVRGATFDVVLCALEMQLQSGMDLYRETLRVAPHLARAFVFATRGALTPAWRAFLEGAPVRHVEKPLDLGALLELTRLSKRHGY